MTWIVVIISLTSPGPTGTWVAQSWFGPYATEEYCLVAANNFETGWEGPQSVRAVCVKGTKVNED